MSELYHYGTPHTGSIPHSGRFEWGSGEKNNKITYDQRRDFIVNYRSLKAAGKTEKEIAEVMGISINELRNRNAVATAEERAANITRARRLKAHGYSNIEIGKIMGDPDHPINESTIRGWLKADEETQKVRQDNTANVIESKLRKGEIIQIGKGAEYDLGVKKATFDAAIKKLEEKGYVVDKIDVPQASDSTKYTTIKVIAPPGTTKRDIWQNRADITTLTEYSPNLGTEFMSVQSPTAVSLDRIKILYSDEKGNGGAERDGLIEIRRGVEDLTLGNSSYAQVRIAVDNGYYIKGMAIYSDNVPKGYDIVVNSNKTEAQGVTKALKKMKPDPDMPFGATIPAAGQSFYKDANGNYIQSKDDPSIYKLAKKGDTGERYSLSPINKLKSEGEWDNYNKSLSSQFLSKQPIQLIQKQLDLTYKGKAEEFDEIMSLSNPMVKQKLLNDFAEGCDKDAKHLSAAALPRQNSRVLIPIPSLADNEVYAPTYKNGETLVLIRHPHGGTFEIPKLVVNNNNPEAKALLKNATDAIGINKHVADRLSGADFDGDHVIAIPVNDKVKVQTSEPLKGLIGFDPKGSYPKYEGMRVMTSKQTQIEMGKISNLITDMTLQNATPDELARAVRHSMVVIDAEKHELNWKQSEKDNAIDALKRKYQENPKSKKGYGGASTLISKAEAELKVNEIQKVNKEGKRTYKADPETGKWFYAETGRTYNKVKRDSKGNIVYDKDGNPIIETHHYKTKTTAMDMTDDARTLSSGTVQEEAYANYANRMKALANQSRKEALAIETPKADPAAKETYKNEVQSLNDKLELALRNKPKERTAQLISNVKIESYKENNPNVTKDKLTKESNKIVAQARLSVGAGKHQIEIEPKEWEAIQANAISGTKLREILNNSDMDKVRKLATPKQSSSLSDAKVSRIKALDTSGFSIAEIADMMGVSTSTVSKYLKS